jgi:putative phage-type endonuclease
MAQATPGIPGILHRQRLAANAQPLQVVRRPGDVAVWSLVLSALRSIRRRRVMYDVIPCEDRADWLQKRTAGIGASDMAAVMGVSSWRSPFELCLEKMGDIEPVDLSDVEAIQWGHKLEPLIVEEFGERSGRLVRPSGELLRSREYPWAQCTLDAETAERPPSLPRDVEMFGRSIGLVAQLRPSEDAWIPLEAKTHSAFQIRDWEDGAPEPYYIQVQHQLLVTGAPYGAIACLIGGARFVWQDIPRDEQMIRRIIWHGERFWQRVVDRDPPPPDGSDSATRAIGRRYPEDNGQEVMLAEELEETAAEILRLQAAQKGLYKELQAHKNRMMLAMGEHERGVFDSGDYLVTAKTQERDGYVKASPLDDRDLRDLAMELQRNHSVLAQVTGPSKFRKLRIKGE